MGRNQLSRRRIWRPLHGRGRLPSTLKYSSSSSSCSAGSPDSHYTQPSGSSLDLTSMVHCQCCIAPHNQSPVREEHVSPGADELQAGCGNSRPSATINRQLDTSSLGSSLIANCYSTCFSTANSHGPTNNYRRLPHGSADGPSSQASSYVSHHLEDATCGAQQHQSQPPLQLPRHQQQQRSALSPICGWEKMSPPSSSNNYPETLNATDTKPLDQHSCGGGGGGSNLSISSCLQPQPSRPGQATSRPEAQHDRQVGCCSPGIMKAGGSLGADLNSRQHQPYPCNPAARDSAGGCRTAAGSSCGIQQQVASEHNCEASCSKLQQTSTNEKQDNQPQTQECCSHNNLGWSDIAMRYRTMQHDPLRIQQGLSGWGSRRQVWFKLRHSCFFQLVLSAIHFVFPILTSFKGYSLPDDLLTDITSGITVAVLHIPQGMAYGTLAGVDPIYGLYVSFIPVLLMSLMSSSRHVSYGTFAIISIMLANSVDSFKANYRLHMAAANQSGELAAVVLVNNHQPPNMAELGAGPSNHQPDSILRNFIMQSSNQQQDNKKPLVDSGGLSGLSTGAPGEVPLFGASIGTGFDVGYEMPDNIEILSTICLVVGLIQILMATMRLGVLSLVLSEQVISGFTTASALHVITSQLGPLFDLSLVPVEEGPFKICRVWIRFAGAMCSGFNKYTGTISTISMLSLLLCKQLLEPKLKRYSKYYSFIPSELILMFILIFCSWRWKFQPNHGVRIIGSIPTELPTINPPRFDIIPFILQDAITIAIFTFAMNFSLGQVYAKRFKYKIKSNQELFAIGTTNCISSFFSCFPCGSSLSRTAMQSNLNVKSPLCPLVSCACILSIICYLAPLLYNLPYCALSCIVVIALLGVLAQGKDLGTYWQQSKLDALVWLVTFVSVIAFNVTLGLVIGVIASLLVILVRLFTPDYSILGRLSGTDLFVDIDAFSDCCEIEQIKILRFNSALCYLNQTIFKSCVENLLPHRAGSKSFNFLCTNKAEIERERIERATNIKFLIIDCSAFSYCDYSGMETLIDIIEEFDERGVRILLASFPLKLIYMIERMKHPKLLLKNIYPTLAGAVNRATSMINQRSQVCDHSTITQPTARYKFSPLNE